MTLRGKEGKGEFTQTVRVLSYGGVGLAKSLFGLLNMMRHMGEGLKTSKYRQGRNQGGG